MNEQLLRTLRELDAAREPLLRTLRELEGNRDAAMRRVIIESPYAGDIERNVAYLRRCLADSLHRGEAPYASHGLYTQPGVLDDGDPEQRRLGIEAGFAWGRVADAVVVYEDCGVTPGMQMGIDQAAARGLPIERRRLDRPPHSA